MPRGRPFKPGNHSGRGRPAGSPNKKTAIAQLVDNHAEALVQKALTLAAAGDSQMIRFLLGRILPPPREQPINIGPLPMGSTEDLWQSLQKLTRKVTSGQVGLNDALGITDLMDHHRKILETVNFELRLQTIEQKIEKNEAA